MKRELSFIATIVAFIVVSLFVLVNYDLANAQCGSDAEDPVVIIEQTANVENGETDKDTVDVQGIVSDDSCIRNVEWTLTHDESGDQEVGTPEGTIDWSDTTRQNINWEDKLNLQVGENTLVVRATDSAGKSGSATLVISYTPPPPGDGLEVTKYKFTAYHQDHDDRFTINAIVDGLVVADACGNYPDNNPITVELEAQQPDDGTYFIIYTLTVAPGDENLLCKVNKGSLRYKNRSDGVRNFTLNESKGNTKLYLYTEKIDFAPDIKDTFRPDNLNEYMEYFAALKGVRLTLTIGEVKYSGAMDHDYCRKYEKRGKISKVECHLNR